MKKPLTKATLSVAESCTGGAISNAITDVPGASNYFKGGVVAYSNELKIDLLGVAATSIQKYGAVSEVVAKEMAEGMRVKAGTAYALAVTGIAGPAGGTKEKPVGTVYIALATSAKTEVKHFCFEGSRLQFKQYVVKESLDWLEEEFC